MKRNPAPFIGLFAATGMLALILDSRTAFAGATEGIELCIRTVIPSLFPFFLLSVILTGITAGLDVPILRPIGKLCRIPKGNESIFLTGLLGGYPVGAQCVSQAYDAGNLSKYDAQRMLGFCSNAGPAFIFGITGKLFSNHTVPLVLWCIQIISAIITGMVLPGKPITTAPHLAAGKSQIGPALMKAIKIMAAVCGWVVIFRIVITFVKRWFLWLLPDTAATIVIGILELTNGYLELATVQSDQLRFILASCFLSFGGLCVGMQTMSVAAEAGLPLRSYFLGKLIQTTVSAALSTVIAGNLFTGRSSNWVYAVISLCCVYFIFRKNRENTSSIPTVSGV